MRTASHLAGQHRAGSGQAAAGGPDRPGPTGPGGRSRATSTRWRRVTGDGLVEQGPVGAAGRRSARPARRGRRGGRAPRRRRRAGRSPPTAPGGPRALAGQRGQHPGPGRPPGRPGPPGPRRAKLWPRTRQDGGDGAGPVVDHHAASPTRSGRPPGASPSSRSGAARRTPSPAGRPARPPPAPRTGPSGVPVDRDRGAGRPVREPAATRRPVAPAHPQRTTTGSHCSPVRPAIGQKATATTDAPTSTTAMTTPAERRPAPDGRARPAPGRRRPPRPDRPATRRSPRAARAEGSGSGPGRAVRRPVAHGPTPSGRWSPPMRTGPRWSRPRWSGRTAPD